MSYVGILSAGITNTQNTVLRYRYFGVGKMPIRCELWSVVVSCWATGASYAVHIVSYGRVVKLRNTVFGISVSEYYRHQKNVFAVSVSQYGRRTTVIPVRYCSGPHRCHVECQAAKQWRGLIVLLGRSMPLRRRSGRCMIDDVCDVLYRDITVCSPRTGYTYISRENGINLRLRRTSDALYHAILHRDCCCKWRL